MSETLTTPFGLGALFKRAERSRIEAERWFRFQKRFDASRRTERDPAANRLEAPLPRPVERPEARGNAPGAEARTRTGTG